MRIFLVGYMGVGKSTYGKKLASRYGLKFIDLDGYISSKESVKVADIIKSKGEDDFRILEKKYLLEVIKLENVLVSTGGGTVCFFDNMTLINQSGVSVYLKLDEKSLAKRLFGGMAARPILKGKTLVELTEFISKHLLTRTPYYNRAHIEFDVLNFTSHRMDELMENINAVGTD
jgi:shikimate kinase